MRVWSPWGAAVLALVFEYLKIAVIDVSKPRISFISFVFLCPYHLYAERGPAREDYQDQIYKIITFNLVLTVSFS